MKQLGNHAPAKGIGVLLLLFSLCLAFLSSGCKNYQNEIEEYLDAANQLWGFEGSVLVSYRGKVMLARGYGMANQQFKIPNTPETKYFIGSITKQFTAAAILILQERGSLNIDSSISTYLKDYPRPAGNMITIRHLLRHTSGVPNYTEWPEVILRRTQLISPGELMALFKNESLDFEPGHGFKYSNSGYIILGAIIEEVSGQSYEAFLHNEILKPLEMYNSGYGRREAAIPNRADGYTIEESGVLINAAPIEFSVLHTAGALYSTPFDLNLWNQALYTDKIMEYKSIEEMFAPGPHGYGFGWFVEHEWGRWHAFHDGFIDGFNTYVDRWFEDQLFIVVLSNEDEAPVKKIARGITAIIYNKDYSFPINKTPAILGDINPEDYEGVFEIGPELYRFVIHRNDSFFTSIQAYPRYLIYPQAIDTFYYAADNTRLLVFVRDSLSRIIGCVDYNDGSFILGKKATDEKLQLLDIVRGTIQLDPSIYKDYNGTYRISTSIDQFVSEVIIHIRQKGNRLEASVDNELPVEIFPSAPDQFIHFKSGYEIIFTRNKLNIVNGCIVRMADEKINGEKIR